MAFIVEIDNNRDGYKTVVDAVMSEGVKVSSRNGNTIEVRDMIVVLNDPSDALPVGVGRKPSAAIGAVEAVQLVAGVSDPILTVAIAPNMEKYLDPGNRGMEFYGAYGPRTRQQFFAIEKKLNDDPDTRQAVITIWDPEKDNKVGKNDYPCTIMHDFLIRDGKLHMSTVMRSNDVWWGWCYDAFQFAAVQLTMADCLQIPVGTYTHHAVSMHLYEPHWELAKQLHEYDGATRPPSHGFVDAKFPGWNSAQSKAGYCLVAARDLAMRWKQKDELETPAEQWYIDTMRKGLLK